MLVDNRYLRFSGYLFYLTIFCYCHIDPVNGQTTTGYDPGYFDWIRRIWSLATESIKAPIKRDSYSTSESVVSRQPVHGTTSVEKRSNDFQIIWNVPSFQCHKYGLNFSEVSEWGILQNAADTFRGDRIALLYDPGYFPALLEANEHSDFVRRNGGVPQEGNLTSHLEVFSQQIDNKLIPDDKFSGQQLERIRRIWSLATESIKAPIKRDSYSTSESVVSRQPVHGTTSVEKRSNDFQIIWNVPSFQCHKYGLNFSEVSEWGILQNAADTFRGDRIALLYDPGYFPALLEANEHSDFVRRNGGVPQEGNLTSHLEVFSQQIDNKLIPDDKFSGVAIIDFEHWRPIWNENFGSLSPYRKVSRSIEQNVHPFWNEKQIEKEASTRFEKFGWQFFRTTLRLAKQLRPNAKWGYYGFPLCFNYTPRNNYPTCSASVRENNDRIRWLFQESTAIYPSLYYKKNDMTEESRLLFMKGRMAEAVRVSQMSTVPTPIYPYTWLKYYDTKELVNKNDLLNSFAIPKREGAAGAIIWGASNDVNNEKKCRSLNNYVQSVLGPVTKLVLQTPKEEIHTLINKIPEKRPITTDKNDLLSNVINHLKNF